MQVLWLILIDTLFLALRVRDEERIQQCVEEIGVALTENTIFWIGKTQL